MAVTDVLGLGFRPKWRVATTAYTRSMRTMRVLGKNCTEKGVYVRPFAPGPMKSYATDVDRKSGVLVVFPVRRIFRSPF